MVTEENERRRRPPFGLYDGFLEGERDDVYERLAVRLKWFGEDCLAAAERIRQEPRYGLDLIDHLSSVVQELDNIAGSAQAKEEAMRQAMSWRIAAEDLLPNHDELEGTRSSAAASNREPTLPDSVSSDQSAAADQAGKERQARPSAGARTP
jgi:hypothetical protein